MTLSVIIPVYNEEGTIAKVIEKVLAQDFASPDANGYGASWDKQIIVVNDGSTDNTEVEIKKLQSKEITYLRHEKNLGKGAAIKTALGHVAGDATIVQDADLEYDPAEISLLLRKSNSGTEIVYGSRELNPKRRGYPHYVLGVRALTWLVNMRFGANLTDIYTCYKLFPADIIKSLNL